GRLPRAPTPYGADAGLRVHGDAGDTRVVARPGGGRVEWLGKAEGLVWRRSAPAGPGTGAAAAVRGAVEHVRPDGNHRLVNPPPGRIRRRPRAHRAADRQYAELRDGGQSPATPTRPGGAA